MALDKKSVIIHLSNQDTVTRNISPLDILLLSIRSTLLSPFAIGWCWFLASVWWSISQLLFSKHAQLLEAPKLRVLMVLPAFLWFSIMSILVDAFLHLWISFRLLTITEAPQKCPPYSMALAWIWLWLTVVFVWVDTFVAFLLSDYCSLLNVTIISVALLHFVSFLSVLVYILRVRSYSRV